MTVWVAVAVGGGLALGFVLGALVQQRRRAAAEMAHRLAEARLVESLESTAYLRQQVETTKAEADLLRLDLVRGEAALEQERRSARDQAVAWEEARQQLVNEFARLSQEALASNNEQFLQLADTRLRAARDRAEGDFSERQQAITAVVRPLGDQLERYGDKVQELEHRRDRAYQELLDKVTRLDQAHRDLERETKNLASALRSPSARGRWGELQLRKVVELAGMLEHCDFDVQVSAGPEGDRQRPDMVVHLPGGKHVVVDAKVPLEAFQSAVACEGEDERRTLLNSHARQVRTHIEALSKKEYWRRFDPSPEFVVAFIPGDPLLSAAFEHDAGLIEFAVANHVLPATPTTLISLLWAVAYGWQQDALADNAREVQRLGSELYQRLATMGDHVAKLGRHLGSSVKAYNETVGSLESRVLVTARRFPELGVLGGSDKASPPLEPVELVPRELQATELCDDHSEEYAEEAEVVAFRSGDHDPSRRPASGHG